MVRTIVALFIVLNVAIGAGAARADYDARYRFLHGKVILKSFEPHAHGIELIFASPTNERIQPSITINGERSDGVLRLPPFPEPREYEYTVTITDWDGSSDSVILSYFPRVLYARHGNSTPAQLIVRSSTIPIAGAVSRFAYGYSTQDLDWARQTWKTTAASVPGRAEEILKTIMTALHGHTGVPSDGMNVPPRAQFERATLGVDEVWCDQIARILQFAFTSNGIESRLIQTGSECQNVRDICISTVEGHTTVEYYSREEHGWVWVDPTIGILGASINDAMLNLNQFVQALDTPLQRQITVRYFDPGSQKTWSGTIADEQIRKLVAVYFRPGVRLYF